jgi:hypothetical protein
MRDAAQNDDLRELTASREAWRMRALEAEAQLQGLQSAFIANLVTFALLAFVVGHLVGLAVYTR